MKQESLPATNGWINRSSGVTLVNSNSQVNLHINPALKLAHVHGWIYTPNSTSVWTNAFTVPNDAKPSGGFNFTASDLSVNVKAALNGAGTASYVGGGTGAYNNFNFTYLLA